MSFAAGPMTSKKPPDKTIAEATPFDAEPTVHVVPGALKSLDPETTIDGLPPVADPANTLDAPPEPPKPLRAAETLFADTLHAGKGGRDTLDDPPAKKLRPHDTLDDPLPRAKAFLAESGDSSPPSMPELPVKVSTAPSPQPSDPVAAAVKRAINIRMAIGAALAISGALLIWTQWPADAPATVEAEVLVPAAPAIKPKPSPDLELESSPVQVEVIVDGRVVRRPGGKVKLISNPPTEVSTAKGKKLGRTPTEVTAEVGPLELTFENRELGISKTVTIEVRPGLGGKEMIEFGRGWLDILAPAGSRVSVDGKAIGVAPVAQQALFAGRHTVTVVRADGTRASRLVTVVAGETLTHEVPP